MVARALDGEIVVRAGDGSRDIVVAPRGSRDEIALQVEWVGDGWPGDLRRVMTRSDERLPDNLVLVAREFSPGALEWLTDHRVSWADETGRARIVGPGPLIVIREPARGVERGSSRWQWSPSSLSLAELLMARPRSAIRVSDAAGEAGWSQAQTSTVLSGFDAAGWTEKHGAARGPGGWRTIADLDGLLSSWSKAVGASVRVQRPAHRAIRDARAFLDESLAPALGDPRTWALSGWAGADVVAPFTTAVPTLHVYVAEGRFAGPLSQAMDEAGLREVHEGARVTFWAADERILDLATHEHGLPIVSPPRLYADLIALGGRARDAAEHVKDELIAPAWALRGDEA